MKLLLFGLAVLVTCALAKDEESTVGKDVESAGQVAQEENPCSHHHCGHGYECDIDNDGNAICVCMRACAEAGDQEQLCSTHNETFNSECHLDRERCLCENNMEQCEDPKHKDAHLDYYGYCREIPVCEDWQMKEFPRRMRDWLKTVMQTLNDRNDLPKPAMEYAEKSQKQEKNWVIPVIWKFCDLDIHPYDKQVSRRELLPLTAALKTLEQCVAPFLDICAGDDKEITLEEWTSCLNLSKDDAEQFNNMCDELHV